MLDDARQGYPYIKRFTFDDSAKRQRFVGDDADSKLTLLTDQAQPMLGLHFADENRVDQELDAAEYIGVKSFTARGKRLTTFALASVELLPAPEPEEPEASEDYDESPDEPSTDAEEPDNTTIYAEEGVDIPVTPSLFEDEETD